MIDMIIFLIIVLILVENGYWQNNQSNHAKKTNYSTPKNYYIIKWILDAKKWWMDAYCHIASKKVY